METIYLCIVIFLLCLAVFDLFVGVSNDAVNFLQSAVGARVATFRTVLIIASVAVVLGAVLSSGMMDIARHGIMMPAKYSFHEVMTIFLAVIVQMHFDCRTTEFWLIKTVFLSYSAVCRNFIKFIRVCSVTCPVPDFSVACSLA